MAIDCAGPAISGFAREMQWSVGGALGPGPNAAVPLIWCGEDVQSVRWPFRHQIANTGACSKPHCVRALIQVVEILHWTSAYNHIIGRFVKQIYHKTDLTWKWTNRPVITRKKRRRLKSALGAIAPPWLSPLKTCLKMIDV